VCGAAATLLRATAPYGPVVVVGTIGVGGLLAGRDIASWFNPIITTPDARGDLTQAPDGDARAAVEAVERMLADARGKGAPPPR